MTIELKRGIFYGPVASRRLGRSLGINLLPPRGKLCPFDCVYCQYGSTACHDPSRLAGELPSVEQVEAAVETALRRLDEPPEWLTFSGNGEPTLHPAFPAMVDAVIDLRDRLCPQARTAILSCSTEIGRPPVQSALGRLDARIMKLDVGSEEDLQRYNRPANGVNLEGIVDGLRQLGDVTIQSLLTAGDEGNFNGSSLKAWLDRVVELAPQTVQIYTLDRPTACHALLPVGLSELRAMAAALQRANLRAEAF
jgi:wyosine [tRNA(Phe)-imidazoG37] synthetase (radical SAM superfamily)